MVSQWTKILKEQGIKLYYDENGQIVKEHTYKDGLWINGIPMDKKLFSGIQKEYKI